MRSAPIHLPRQWTKIIRSGVLQATALAHGAIMQARGKAACADKRDRREATRVERLEAEVCLLREELRIKDARMERVAAHRRPHYTPFERMIILEHKAARGWSIEQAARAFLVTPQTIAQWLRRIDEPGPCSIAKLSEPVNKFPEFVGYLVRRLKTLCPKMGKRKVAETLARAGLHLSATTVGRILQAPPQHLPTAINGSSKPRAVAAKRPNQVWHVDLTTVPITSGFWVPWPPLALLQRWPYCWWMTVVVDHYSRRVMGTASFTSQPTSEQVRTLLGRAIHQAGAAPQHLVCDRGKQFDCHGFRRWCGRKGIQLRYGAVGKPGSIAVVERLIRTLKECLRQLLLVPMRGETFRRELHLVVDWYNDSRPHSSLGGKTPNEVYYPRYPAIRRPRYEPRPKWPRGSPCARPWALTRGKPGARLAVQIELIAGRKHLPLVSLKRVA